MFFIQMLNKAKAGCRIGKMLRLEIRENRAEHVEERNGGVQTNYGVFQLRHCDTMRQMHNGNIVHSEDKAKQSILRAKTVYLAR